MRRPALVALICLAAPLLTLPSRAATDKGTDKGWTSYDVTLAPLPNSLQGCAGGVEGVHVATRTVTAPHAGRLEVEMPGVPGDFDIGLINPKGQYVGNGGFGDQTFGPGSSEQATARVARGARISIQVCNYSSAQPTAAVRYRFVRQAADPRPAKGFRALSPGNAPTLTEKVPVNVVLVGYGKQVNTAALRRGLPKVNRPHERIAAFYGYERPLGITYTYDYHVSRAGKAYEDRFFHELARLGRKAPLTTYQEQYNDQKRNAVVVRDGIRISAPKVERWLAEHPPAGVDTARDTVFLVNWWGRKDFRFHVYEQTLEPITDTGVNRGKADYQALVAWGGSSVTDPETGMGTPRRVWFHDLSAGPDYWTGTWSVDPPSVDEGAVVGKHLLPTWEYGHAFPAEQLTPDLTALVRYTAVDLLFTPSPLYSLEPQGARIARTVDVDVNAYELDPGAPVPYKPTALRRSVGALSPAVKVTSDLQRLGTGEPLHGECFAHDLAVNQAAAQGAYLPGPGCQPQYRYGAFDDPFVFAASHLSEFLDDPKADREIAVFSYQVPDNVTGCFAYADDNHLDGTPSMVFGFFPTACRAAIGTTDILTHEVGHELGMSHPHDGYDYEEDRDFGAYGDTFFVGAGDEVSSVMSYLFVNNEYSQFDRDSHARYMTSAYLHAVNTIAAQVLARPGRARSELGAADEAALVAAQRFAGHRYEQALAAASSAYDHVLRAAAAAGVKVTASTAGTDLVGAADAIADRLSAPKGRGYSRAHVLDPSTGLPVRCMTASCSTWVPLPLSDLGGPSASAVPVRR
jgi:hypothetical protein